MNLFLQSDPRPIHFVGIGGAGMGALALIARRRGLPVTGSDADVSGCGDLISAGATVVEDQAPALVALARAVIASAAIPAGHPDLVAAAERGVPVVSRKVALADLIGDAACVAIAGTHGKTTTTVMATEAMGATTLAPTGIAGGRVSMWGGNAKLASEALFVVEADEFDQAFLTLTPRVAVINNVEVDHLECYGSVEALEDAFVRFARPAERVLIGTDGEGTARVADRLDPDRLWRFGFADDSPPGDLLLSDVELDAAGSRALLSLPDGRSQRMELAVPGRHNLRNAAGALGAVAALGGSLPKAALGLAAFGGVGRRFERIGEADGVTIVDDYAHHPTEVEATLLAARQAFPTSRLVAVFQPHLFSRTATHGPAIGRALAAADLAIVTAVYAAREVPVPGVSEGLVADAVTAEGGRVVVHADRPSLGARVAGLLHSGDLLLTLGAGDITRLGPQVISLLEAR